MSASAQHQQSSDLGSLLSGFTQNARIIKLSTVLGPDVLLAECVRGEEGISQGFRFKVAALSQDAALSLKALIGQPVLIELMTAASRDQLRPFHGHVTTVDMAGANGGFARYNLTVEPWTAFLAPGRDSRIFQDMTVFDILDTVFAAYQGQGKLAPAWRFDILDRTIYPKRSITTQYQESDLAFAERLMHEEGLFHYFEHAGDSASPGLGSHTMVIADHNGSFKPNAQASIAYTQPGATMVQDSMDRWRTELRLQTNGVELSSWDYRSLDTRPVTATSSGNNGGDSSPLVSRDTPGAYAYQSREQGQRVADNQLQALEAAREVHVGAGTVRTLAPGTTFALTGQAQFDLAGSDDERSFLVVRVVHLMHNNLSADMKAGLMQRLGQGLLDALIGEEEGTSLHAVGKGLGQRPLYRNRIDAIRNNIPYRSSGADAHGRLLHPRPTIHGQQTAIVVGPGGTPIHTDRDHRVKVQFHWQRGAQSHSRLQHPMPDGHTGAPGDDQAGTWVRVATPMAPVAGANWGSSALPRVGQEVLIDFLEGNIDRPVVLGTVYNGRGQADAQHNQVSAGAGTATGNAPAWFPGESGGHAHPAALSGIKTQAMQASQGGSGAYNQLVFDDSPGQSRVALQRHATAHQGTAELNLGHLRHQSDNQRLQTAGFGAELKTEYSVALRAGKGLLLSTNARASATGNQMDAKEAIDQIEQSVQLQTDLAEMAQKHSVLTAGGKAQAGAGAAATPLPAIEQLKQSAKVLAATETEVPAYSAPQLQLSSPSGIAVTTPVNAVLGAETTTSLTAGHDINFAAQANTYFAVKDGIKLVTYGKATNAQKPNQEIGIKLHAASGKVSSQSQSDETKLTSDKALTVSSVTKSVTASAKQYVALTAQGAVLKMEGGNIMLHGPGKIEFKASQKELTGPATASAQAISLPTASKLTLCELRASGAAAGGESMVPAS
ncbi:type VI secretion system secreted protein VgrG [Duganella sp. 3397]|uniref:type VI secretion system Vgr family protein n=1 Tax=Duganella sp. 3397 TaxID=2817732 RepID=UPI002855B5F8|nr:type VI secretion system tip protein TssI/VgrG [Duganella sp. 3397]MDR7049093.1 type VI secretion system secreted protein VgrG [Duganella sp. 3397]